MLNKYHMLNLIFDEVRCYYLKITILCGKLKNILIKNKFNFRITDWEHFKVGKDFYLLAGNSLRPGTDFIRYKIIVKSFLV